MDVFPSGFAALLTYRGERDALLKPQAPNLKPALGIVLRVQLDVVHRHVSAPDYD